MNDREIAQLSNEALQVEIDSAQAPGDEALLDALLSERDLRDLEGRL